MRNTLLAILLFTALLSSCKKDYVVLNEETTQLSISEKAVKVILTKKYFGQTIGKRHHNFNGVVQIDPLNYQDSIQFIEYSAFNNPEILGLKINHGINHDMLLIDSNLNDKYLLFSNRNREKTTFYPPNNLEYTDKYMDENTGPEAVLIYYYQKDSLVYFRNTPPYSSGGSFSRSYQVTFAK